MAKRRGNHEGSIKQRTNGAWRTQLAVNGQRLSYTGKSQKECQLWIRKTLNDVDRGGAFDGQRITVAEFLSNWQVTTEPSLRPKTYGQYLQIIRDYLIPAFERVKLAELHPYLIQSLYDKLVIKGTGRRTIRLIHSVLHRSLNHAIKMGLIGRNPASATTPPKPRKNELKVLDASEAQALIIATTATEDPFLALYQLALTTGMRQGELLGLKWDDVDWERGSIRVVRQLRRIPNKGFEFAQPKTKSGVRVIKIGENTLAILKDHRRRQFEEMSVVGDSWVESELVFSTPSGDPIHHSHLYRKFKALLKLASLPDIRFHDLRHTAASLMLNSGVPVLVVSQRLGHAKPSITLDIYGHFIPSMQDQVADLMDEVVAPIEFGNCTKTAPELHQGLKTSAT